MSRPPLSKVTPLPTSVTFGASLAAPDEIDDPRRLGRGAPDGVNERQVRGEEFVAADDADAGVESPRRACTAACSSASGPSALAGALTRSRPKATAAAMRSIRAASTPSGATSRGFSGSDRP